jgi:hypothetical protein
MTPDGKIGSVYFGDDEGRIRTTHRGGPEKKQDQDRTTVRFNIDHAEAGIAYNGDTGREPSLRSRRYRRWLAERLKDSTVDNAPSWAIKVEGPETAHELSEGGGPPENLKLFEIFKRINGDVQGWHPSRGAAVKFETDKQTISVLDAAIEHINRMKLEDPGERNTAFYEFVKARLPKFMDYMRHPDEI